MKVKILKEEGYDVSLYGMGKSFEVTSDILFEDFIESPDLFPKMERVAGREYAKDNGSNKFLEFCMVWLELDFPRYLWSEMDTYRAGMSKLSESTMHTLHHRELTNSDFEFPLPDAVLFHVNEKIKAYRNREISKEEMKNILPEGFLQDRVIITNYKTLRHIMSQRHNHELRSWHKFCNEIRKQVKYPAFFSDISESKLDT